MNKVFVVTEGSYSDYHICGIFRTRPLAEKYISEVEPGGDIEEFTLDVELEKVRRIIYLYGMPDGNSWKSYDISKKTERVPEDHIRHHYEDKFTAASYVSAGHAKKLAIEEYQRRLRAKGLAVIE